MNKVRMIENDLVEIDKQLTELYKKKDELNKELSNIQAQKLQQEIEHWKLMPGKCYIMFDKDSDSSYYRMMYGYQIIEIRDDDFCRTIQTKYSIDVSDRETYLQVKESLISLHSLRTYREHNNVYCVDAQHYRELQIRFLSMDIESSELLKEFEEELVKPRALYQVD